MQKEDIALETIPEKKQPAISLYTEEEIGDVSTTSSWTKVDSTVGSEVNVSEVSSTSEDTGYQPPRTSSTSLFTDLHNEQVVDSGSETVTGVKNRNSVSGDARNDKKPKPGLSLLGEYADSGNDTEEETQHSLVTKQDKLYEVEETSSDKIRYSNPESASTEAEHYENQSSNKTVETGVIDASVEIPQTISDGWLPVEVKTEYGKDVDAHTHPDNSFAKLKRSVSKEEGQISADSDSSGSERSSESRKGSKTQKGAKKDKSKKKDKKKKKKRKRKQKHSSERRELDVTESEEKKKSKLRRSRSRETSEKQKPLRRSRSRSRDRDSKRRRRTRSSSRDKGKSRHLNEQSRRSRSRSTGRRSSATNRNRDLKSRSKSPKRSVSPPRRRRDRGARYSPVSRGRRESPSLKRKRVSRSHSPRRSSERRKSRSPMRRTRSPDKRKRTTPDRSPGTRSTPRKARSPNRKEKKRSPSPPRKSSHRTSSASDSLDSGHFTNIPLSKSNKLEEHVSENKESGQKPLPHSNKSSVEKQESIIVPKPAEPEKQYSPSGSPAKPWEDEFDFVFTEHMSPRQGTGKSMEDVLFGTEAKTPDFKRPTPSESKKSKQKESKHTEKKEETKTDKLKGVTALADRENKLLQTLQNQNRSSNLQSKSTIDSDEQSLSTQSDSKSGSKASKSDIKDDDDHIKKTGNNVNPSLITNTHDKSTFVQSKPETIPFLDENPYVPPPVDGVGTQNSDPVSQLGTLGPPPALHDRMWLGLGQVGLLPSQQNVNSGKNDIKKSKLHSRDQSVTGKDEGHNVFDGSPVDMEMSSPEGDIIDQMNEEFWKQQQKSSLSATESEDSKSREEAANPVVHGQSLVEEPYEPESGLLIGEESEEDLTKITDPKERRKREKQQEKEKTKVQELIDKLHRQARVEEEVKHALKAYYKHRDISKDEYKSILRRAVPQVTNSSSAIDPERIRSLVKKYVAKMKGQRVDSL